MHNEPGKQRTNTVPFRAGQGFVYDGDSVALVFDDAGSLTSRVLHGPAIDQILAEETGGDVFWSLGDHQQTVRDRLVYDELTGLSSVAEHLQFDAFGNITSAGAVDALFTYTGREWDADAGLYYYRAR